MVHCSLTPIAPWLATGPVRFRAATGAARMDRDVDRNPIVDLEAVAAMPGLDEVAELLAPGCSRGSTDPRSILMFLAGRWAFGSANQMDSVMATTDVWDSMVRSAARVGRTLSAAPPTFAQLHHLPCRLDDEFAEGLADRLEATFTRLAVDLAPAVGLLGGAPPSTHHRPQRGRTIYGDGSVFAALSDVSFDADGIVSGSRAAGAPRLPVRFEGKDGASSSPKPTPTSRPSTDSAMTARTSTPTTSAPSSPTAPRPSAGAAKCSTSSPGPSSTTPSPGNGMSPSAPGLPQQDEAGSARSGVSNTAYLRHAGRRGRQRWA